MGDDRGNDARHDDGRKAPTASEPGSPRGQKPGQRCVDCRRNAGRGAGRHGSWFARDEAKCAAEKRCDRRPQHGDRALAAGRAAKPSHRARRSPGKSRCAAIRPPSRAIARRTSGTLAPSYPRPGPRMIIQAIAQTRPGEHRPIGDEAPPGEVPPAPGRAGRRQGRSADRTRPHRSRRRSDGHGEPQEDRVLVEMQSIEPVGETTPDACPPSAAR